MKTIKSNIYRLPTDIPAHGLSIRKDNGQLMVAPRTEDDHQQAEYINLYFTTDEKPKEGEWAYDIIGNDVYQWKKSDWDLERDAYEVRENSRKIIATNDPELTHYCRQCSGKMEKDMDGNNQKVHIGDCISFMERLLPEPSQSFIEEYCKAGGIDEVLVEYGTNGVGVCGHDCECRNGCEIDNPVPKLNPDNTIIIHPVEEKMIPLSEVKSILIKFYQGLKGLTEEKDRMHLTYDDLDKWIEENL